MTLSVTWLPFSAADRPSRPTAPAMMMLGVMLILRVTRRRNQGAMVQFRAPSDTIWPAMVQMMPALMPDRSKARANTVPAAGAMLDERRE